MTIITDASKITDKQFHALYEEAYEAAKKIDFTGLDPFTKNPGKSLIVLDFDGSNSVFVPEICDAVLYTGLKERVEQLNEKYTVVISSGRGMNDLRGIIDIPQIENYAWSHGSEILVNGEPKKYIEDERAEKLHATYQIIIAKMNLPIPVDVEIKLGNRVVHWKKYCEENKMTDVAVKEVEEILFRDHICPAIEEYNKGQINPTLRIKVVNHESCAELMPKDARNKGHALLDFVFLDYKPIYKNILVLGDSASDGDMIRMADKLSAIYNIYAVSVTVQQRRTPEWMMQREYPHIVLPYCKDTDPDMKLGGGPFV